MGVSLLTSMVLKDYWLTLFFHNF